MTKKSKTEGMLVDIDSIPNDLNPVLENDFLRGINSWKNIEIGPFDKNQVVRYLVYLYSYDSFLNKKNPLPIDERKEIALSLAGIKKTKDAEKFLFELRNDAILLMVRDFLIAQNNLMWTEIVTTEQQYSEAIKLRLKPIKEDEPSSKQLDASKNKKALRIDCKDMQAELKGLYRKFYLGDGAAESEIKRRASSLERLAKSAKDV